jgi:hypothetical protein
MPRVIFTGWNFPDRSFGFGSGSGSGACFRRGMSTFYDRSEAAATFSNTVSDRDD